MSEATVNMPSALAQLCAAYGIAPAYHDIWGNRIDIPQSTLIALLAEFDVDAGTPEGASEALRKAQSAAWREALPAVAAINAGSAHWSVRVRLPGASGRLRWMVTEEGGARHQGEVDFATLPEQARMEIDGVPLREVRLELSLELPPGYHRLTLEGLSQGTLLIAAPPRCYLPPALAEAAACGGRRCNSIRCARSATGASVTSATSAPLSSTRRASVPASSASIRCMRCSRTIRRTRVRTVRRRASA